MMKTVPMHRKAALILALLVVCCPLSALAAIVLSFDEPANNVAQGEEFSVDLVADIDPSMAIASFGLDVTFDATILDTVSAVVPTPNPFVGSLVDTSTDGLIALTGFAPPGPGLSGLLTLATLTFTAEMIGTTALDVAFPDFPVLDGFALVAGGVVLPDVVTPGQVTVVPLPAGAWLLGSGLVAFGAVARRRRMTA